MRPGASGDLEDLSASPTNVGSLSDAGQFMAREASQKSFFSLIRYNKLALAVTASAVTIVLGVGVGTLLWARSSSDSNALSPASQFGSQQLVAGSLPIDGTLELAKASSLAINGSLRLNGGLVVAPSATPAQPEAGQIYFDKDSNKLFVYNGTEFDSISSGAAVQSLGGSTGDLSTSADFQVINNQLALAPRLKQLIDAKNATVQGQTAQVQLTAGTGIVVSGTTINNAGVLSIVGANGLQAVQTNGNVTVSLPQALGTADSPTFAAVQLSSALGVAYGGTGLSFGGMTANSVMITSADGSSYELVPATVGGQCLITDALDSNKIKFGNCSGSAGGGGVTSLNAIDGDATLASSDGSLTVVNNVAGKSIDLKLPQALGTTASPTFTGVTASSFTGNGSALTAVNAAQLNGQAASFYTDAGNLGSGTLADARLSSNVAQLSAANNFTGSLQHSGNAVCDASNNCNYLTGASAAGSFIQLQGATPGTAQVGNFNITGTGRATTFYQNGNAVCDMTGNCAGAGGGLTGAGTAGTIAVYTATGVLGNSLLTQSGSTVSLSGTLAATTLTGNGAGVTNVDATLLNGQAASYYTDATNITAGTLADGRLSANVALLNAASNTFTGALTANSLTGNGAGLTNVDANKFNGQIASYYTDASNISSGTLADARLSANVALLNAASNTFTGSITATGFTGNGAGVTSVNASKLNGQVASYYTNANNITAGTLADARLSANVALLNALSNTFTGTLTAATLNGDGTGVTNVDAAKLGGQTGGYYLDATNLSAGTLADARLSANVALLNATNNFTGVLQHNGNAVCDISNNCGYLTGSAASGSYIELQATTPGTAQTGNFNITGTGRATALYQNGNQVCDTTGNCAGAGGGVTGSGTSGTLAMFTGSGTISDSLLSQAAGTVTVGGTLAATTLTGDGTGVTNVDAATLGGQAASYYTDAGNIASGTLDDARLTANVALLNALSNTFTGTVVANALSGNGAGVTNVDAAKLNGQVASFYTDAGNLTAGTLDDARLSANVALLNALSNTFTGSLTASSFTGNGAGVTNVDAAKLGGQAASYYTNATNISAGTLADARLSANVALLNAASNTFTGTLTATSFTGNGAGLTNVDAATLNGQAGSYYTNASNLSTGTLADARLSANVALLNAASNTFTGTLTASSFTGNGAGVTNVDAVTLGGQAGSYYTNATNLSTGTLADARLSANVALLNAASNTFTGTLSANALNGNGAGVTNVNAVQLNGQAASFYTNASNLVSGTLADARLSANVALLNAVSNTFTGSLTATTLSGNGAGVTNVDAAKLGGQAASYYTNATNLSSGTVADARLSANVALLNAASNTFTGTATIGSDTLVKTTTNSTTAFQVQNAAGAALLKADTANSQITIKGGTAGAVVGADTIKTSTGTNDFPAGWGAPANWTLSANSAVHVSGSITALTSTWTPTIGASYLVTYTYSGCSVSNTLGVTMGGQTLETTTSCPGTNTRVITATSTAGLKFTPNSTYAGTISNVTVTLLTLASNTLSVQNSSSVTTLEIRSSSSATNAFLGVSSGQAVTTGIRLTAVGSTALQSNTTGTDNTATGYNSLLNNISGSFNTATGSYSLQNNTSGQYNTATGYQTLQSNTTGQFNTAHGYQSLQNNTTGTDNTAFGYQTLQSTITGQYNTAVGRSALQANTVGQYNTATGYSALQSNTADNNTASGSFALQSNTSGTNNTAAGYTSLRTNTTGSRNTSSGYQSLYSNTTGADNTASGTSALQSNTTGLQNTAFGAYGLFSNTTGSNNSALGYMAGYQDSNTRFKTGASLQNATAIGYSAQVQANNTLALGSVDTATQVVIGATVGISGTTFGVSPVHLNSSSITASQTSGSGTITASGAIFTANNVGEEFIWADGTTETITAYTDSTHVTGSSTVITETTQYFRTHYIGFQVTNTGNVYIRSSSSSAFQVQNASGTSMLTADTTTGTLTVTTVVITANITVNGHIIGGGSNPTIAAGTAACTTPTVTVNGSDTAGKIVVTTGTGCASTGKLATITFASVFGSAPRVTLTAAGVNAAGLTTYIDDTTISTASFDLSTLTTPASSTTYTWYYHAIQ